MIHFADGFLVYDDDGETILKIVRRLPGSNPTSTNVCDFFADVETPAPSADLRIASGDLFALITAPAPATGERERDTLLRQIGVLALLLSEKAKVYQRGGKPNARQTASAVTEMAAALPEANAHGLSPTNIRKNISKGIALLGQ
ncbi:MAG TPA: hypothetical protein VF573_27290 [Paraburkholderia sp.]|uniref:hypothetical protein n=1 Tax=Paraburkholderia sp. TaxID=1926495 RepID=UPI002ED56F62